MDFFRVLHSLNFAQTGIIQYQIINPQAYNIALVLIFSHKLNILDFTIICRNFYNLGKIVKLYLKCLYGSISNKNYIIG